MSEPEVEALVSQKYEIKKRLGKGVSAWGGAGELGEPGGGVRRCLRAGPAGPVSAASWSLLQAAGLSRVRCWRSNSLYS